jgi:short-subunit dehydrogenase
MRDDAAFFHRCARAAQVVLLTGASRGLGAALARAFAAEGCHLCLVARSPLDLTRTQAECHAASSRGVHGGKVITVVADVCSAEECARVVAQCRNVLGPCDILVNNGDGARVCFPFFLSRALTQHLWVPLCAAAMVTWQPFSALPVAQVNATLCCNIVAPMLLTHHVLPDMLRRRAGTIINVSSACVATAHAMNVLCEWHAGDTSMHA